MFIHLKASPLENQVSGLMSPLRVRVNLFLRLKRAAPSDILQHRAVAFGLALA